MKSLKGKGPYRFEERCGKFPWTPFYRFINLATGNLMVTETDLSYPSRGMNIACTRTYNAHDDKIGPFGKGWSFSYDMALYTDPQDPVGTLDRKTWNGTVLPYQVDADGLITPPVFVHDKTARTKWMVRVQQSDGSFSQLIYVADYLERYVANYSNIGFIISLILFPEECRFRPPEHWIEIEGGHCARGRHQFRTMMVNLITLWATIQWFGIVGVEIAFEEGI
jgi:hypothetical protein